MDTERKIDNPWREFIENVINGDNYFRTSEYYDLIADIDARIVHEQSLKAEVERLTAELAECRKDAERYRWLSNQNKSFFGEGENFAVVIDDQDGGTWVGSDLDQAIDTAMEKTK